MHRQILRGFSPFAVVVDPDPRRTSHETGIFSNLLEPAAAALSVGAKSPSHSPTSEREPLVRIVGMSYTWPPGIRRRRNRFHITGKPVLRPLGATAANQANNRKRLALEMAALGDAVGAGFDGSGCKRSHVSYSSRILEICHVSAISAT